MTKDPKQMVLWYSVEALAAFHGQRLLVARVDTGMPIAHVAKSQAPRTSPKVEQAEPAMRQRVRRGQDWLGAELGLPARTVNRILRVVGSIQTGGSLWKVPATSGSVPPVARLVRCHDGGFSLDRSAPPGPLPVCAGALVRCRTWRPARFRDSGGEFVRWIDVLRVAGCDVADVDVTGDDADGDAGAREELSEDAVHDGASVVGHVDEILPELDESSMDRSRRASLRSTSRLMRPTAAPVLLVLLGIRWVAAHVSTTVVKQLNLTGSGSTGRLGVDGTQVASAAAETFSHTLGVRSAKGRINRDRGQVVAGINATIEPEADLAMIAEQADLVSAQLGQVLGRDDLRCSVQLTVARTGKALNRVS